MRAIGTELQTWRTSVNTFRDKYFALPGDMRNATQFWGAVNTGGANGNCSAPFTDLGTGTQTCNGNGDGRLYQGYEIHRFWQHLANAGLINGEFTGTRGSATTVHSVIGENAPKSKFGSLGWSIYEMANSPTDTYFSGDGYFFAGDYGHVYNFGGQHHSGSVIGKALSPSEAWNIDTKYDDGKPARGVVIAHWWDDCTLATSHTDNDADYDLQVETIECSLVFKGAL